MSVVVVNHVTLDGVMQSPGRPDEDTRGGFARGGWATTESDPALGDAMREAMGENHAWLFGRRTYDDLLSRWNAVGGPFATGLNEVVKYVATADETRELPWPNSIHLSGDVPSAVSALRESVEGNLVIMGSGVLIRSLLVHGLVDRILLITHPVTVGGGKRMFPDDGTLRRFTLEDCGRTAGGLIMARYAKNA
jgi:dihydrofolate reductase